MVPIITVIKLGWANTRTTGRLTNWADSIREINQGTDILFAIGYNEIRKKNTCLDRNPWEENIHWSKVAVAELKSRRKKDTRGRRRSKQEINSRSEVPK